MLDPSITAPIVEDDLIARDAAGERYEVMRGAYVLMSPVGALNGLIVNNCYDAIAPVVKRDRLGLVFTDGVLFRIAGPGNTVQDALVPDVAFVRRSSIPRDWDIKRPFPGAPDLAIEVISPGDDAAQILDQVRIYLDAGTEQVLLLYPEQIEVHQYRRGSSSVQTYRGPDTLDLTSLLPDLRISVSRLFEIPDLTP